MCGGLYVHESSQNEHIKENQIFSWFEKKQEYKDKLLFLETTITYIDEGLEIKSK